MSKSKEIFPAKNEEQSSTWNSLVRQNKPLISHIQVLHVSYIQNLIKENTTFFSPHILLKDSHMKIQTQPKPQQ